MQSKSLIHPDITQAQLPPADTYTSESEFHRQRQALFLPSWQWAANADAVRETESVFPFFLLENFLHEPLLLSRDAAGNLNCMSNVCTHRGGLLARKPGKCSQLRCPLHGRTFSPDGVCLSMPGMENTPGFPSLKDHLPHLPLFSFGRFLFTSVAPAHSPVQVFGEMLKKTAWLPFEQFMLDSSRSREITVSANWMLLMEILLDAQRLEFPFRHQAATDKKINLFPLSASFTFHTRPGEPAFVLPLDHPDFGHDIGGYIFWMFPNTLFYFYPWGFSLSLVQPVTVSQTRLRQITYMWKPELLPSFPPAEASDESLAEAVQQSLHARLQSRSHYAPLNEAIVHHFHRLVFA